MTVPFTAGNLLLPVLFAALFTAIGLLAPLLPPDIGASTDHVNLHTVLEFIGMSIALMVFSLTWAVRQERRSSIYGFLGAIFLAVALVDLAHTLSFPGMPEFHGASSPDRTVFFWLAGRTLLLLGLLVAALMPYRQWPLRAYLGMYLGALLLTAAIWRIGLDSLDLVPPLFVPGRGLTPVKIGYEYALFAGFGLVALLLARRARRKQDEDTAWLAAATWVLALAELFFATFVTMGDIYNVAGHVFRLSAYLMIYRALFVSGVRAPYRELAAEREKVAEFEQRWKFAIEGSAQGVWDWDPRTNKIYFSPQGKRMFGLSDEEVIGHLDDWRSRVHPDDFTKVAGALQAHLRGETPIFESPHRVRHKDGSWRWILDRGMVAARDAAGKPIRIVGTMSDITPLMEAQEALRDSEARYRSVIEGMAEGLILHGRDGRVIACNSTAERVLGIPHSKLIGMDGRFPGMQAITEDGSPYPPENYPANLTLASGEAQRGVIIGILRGNQLVWLSVNTRPLQHPDEDRPYAAVCTFEDITRQRLDMEALRQSEERFRAIFDAAPTGVVMLTASGHIVQVNPVMSTLFGLPAGEFPHRQATDLACEDDRERLRDIVTHLAAGEPRAAQLELRCQRGDGSRFWAALQFTTLTNPLGQVTAIVAVVEDIDARLTARLAVEAANRRLTDTLATLERHDREITLVNQLYLALQKCDSEADAHSAIAVTMREIFPRQAGGLAVRLGATSYFDVVARWGDASNTGQCFNAEDCCALRDGLAIATGTGRDGANCRHLAPAGHDEYRCIPLLVQDKAIGLLTISGVGDLHLPLLDMLAEAIKLALSNLRLRTLLEHEATHDPLTGMYNRRYLDLTLPRELARCARHGSPLTLAMVDADHFKRFNDSYGHEAGDRVLIGLGRIFNARLRRSDIGARYGGEEFVLVLPDTAPAGARELLQAVVAEIAQLRVADANVTVSIGLVQAPPQGCDMDTLLRAADAALYQAKAAGRNRIELGAVAENGVALTAR